MLAKTHQADCGNSAPTTYMSAAEDVYNEGALIFPAVRIQRDYAHIDDIVRMCRMRIRVPEQWWGDYLALTGAARVGESGLLELGRELGWQALEDFTRDYLDYSEARAIAAIRALPGGTTEAMSMLDPSRACPEGLPIRAKICCEPAAARITVDLTDNPDCLPNGLNMTEATARMSAMVGAARGRHGDGAACRGRSAAAARTGRDLGGLWRRRIWPADGARAGGGSSGCARRHRFAGPRAGGLWCCA